MARLKFILIPLLFIFLSTELAAQHPHRRHRRAKKVVVVKRSPYRPAKVVVYRPHWRPTYTYHRRWVFFPRYNIYWDNWRNHYVFWNGAVWVSQATAPPVIVNVNLEKEHNVELPENEEDEDDVYKSNETHKSQYKNE